DRFEREFIGQGIDEDRDIEKTLEIGWSLLSLLPESELARIDPDIITKFRPKPREEDDRLVS
ncbi:MAG: V-type ATP synthase subunit B, partial [Candidatus Bathyarchaeota archaeon]